MKNTIKLCIILVLLYTTISAQTTVSVSTASELQTALDNAEAGQTILLTRSSYVSSNGFKAKSGKNGTANNPIILKSMVNASLSTGSISKNYALHLPKNDYWIIDGIQLINSKKGLILDNSNYNIIQNVSVDTIGEEGIHLRTFSCYNTIRKCHFDNTGKLNPGYGEGIYFGSAYTNWSKYTDGKPDKSDYNTAEYNSFGDNVIAENIDIKEGTQYGIIRGNIFNGKGLKNDNSADSFIDIKGNYYIIECNSGANALKDGIQTHIVYKGWGNYNTFKNNSFNIGNRNGYAIFISKSSSKGTANDNIVCNTNSFSNAKELTNSTIQICETASCDKIADYEKNKN